MRIITFGVFMGLVGSIASRKAITRLLARFRDFEHPEHAPRSLAGTYTCAVVYRRPSCVTHSREREKRLTGAGEKRANVQNNVHLVLSTRFPFGMWVT